MVSGGGSIVAIQEAGAPGDHRTLMFPTVREPEPQWLAHVLVYHPLPFAPSPGLVIAPSPLKKPQ